MISSSDISCRITFSLASKSSNSDSMHAFFLFHLPLADTWKKLLRSLKRLLFFHPSKHCAHRSIGSRIKESAAYCNQILLVLLYLMYTQNTSVNWIYVVILLSGGHCTTNFFNWLRLYKLKRDSPCRLWDRRLPSGLASDVRPWLQYFFERNPKTKRKRFSNSFHFS